MDLKRLFFHRARRILFRQDEKEWGASPSSSLENKSAIHSTQKDNEVNLMAELTPMMKQYLEIKKDNPDSILFFRLGDFYEMFADDAKLASRELDLTLTSRDHGKHAKPEEERVPMCGIPYHASEAYIARLIAKGYKVAICEQM